MDKIIRKIQGSQYESDMWQDEASHSTLDQTNSVVREKEKKKKKREREERSSIFSLRSMEIGGSIFVRPRTKDHLLDKGYAWVSKTRDFVEDSSEDFEKSRVLGLGSVHGTS